MNSKNTIEFLLNHNKKQSDIYCTPDETLSRRRYRAEHPTEIAALKCMDGRLNLPVITQTPTGIIQPFRNMGGKFDLGWPYFGQLIQDWVTYSVGKGRDGVILVTYHYSKADNHRGCAGFDYDTEIAKKHTFDLKQQIEVIFGSGHNVVYPIVIGIETDLDTIIIHGKDGSVLDLSTLTSETAETMRARVERMFPDMNPRVVADIIPLLLGNMNHIAELRASGREVIDTEHRERVIALGRGFGWLHLLNYALIIGPYSYDLTQPVATAGRIILSNIESGRIAPDDEIVLMVAALHRESVGPELLAAQQKANSLANFGRETIERKVPELYPHLKVLAGTVDGNTMLFTPNPENMIGV